MLVKGRQYRTVWMDSGTVRLIEQRRLPHFFEIVSAHSHLETCQAIRDMVVRGAGAIGATAGFAMAQAALAASKLHPASRFAAAIRDASATIKGTRPTAQNLFYAVERVLATMGTLTPAEAAAAAVREAQAIADEDAAMCKAIGEHGLELFRSGTRMLTHCNAGWLAFVDWGSALSPVYSAARAGKQPFVWVDETRPRSQGAKLTSWELMQEHIPHAIIADNAAGHFFSTDEIDLVIVGADRIAANGDVANKIGTYEKALLAREHGVPFYVAAPFSTIDAGCPSGKNIPIEERGEDEVLFVWGITEDGKETRVRIASAGARARNPAFDVTPARLVTGIITPHGIMDPKKIASLERKVKTGKVK